MADNDVTAVCIQTLILTDTVCSTHVAEDDVTAHVHSDTFQSPVTSGDIASFIWTSVVYSLRGAEDDVTAVCIQNQKFV